MWGVLGVKNTLEMHWFISPTLFPKSQSHSQSSVQICTILFPKLQLSLCFFSSKHPLSARRCFFVFLMSSGAQVCLLQHRLWFQCSKQIICMASSSLTSAANYIQGENHSIGKETWPRKCALQETQTCIFFCVVLFVSDSSAMPPYSNI